MAIELILLKSGQHVITFVPKLITELPFFNLTSRRKDIPKVIKYEGLDGAGHPIRWEVYQNTSKEIGAPGVEAHQVWYLLIKPSIDESRREDNTIPEIIPLGKIRECLRKVGWAAGGRQERDLIQALRQISFAGCVADLWIPTGQVDEFGKQKYLQVKGSFSRLSVYAIGEYHVTDEELANIQFKFDLEDVLYIKLDTLEAKIQQVQDQRVFDNEYLFSVDPASRRWYELMAAKIFGVVKNKASFCEVRYSWYIKHHHTLKRFYERRRVVEQMNRIAKDHLESSYINKVEYRAIKEPDKEIDYIIRYYPGEGAKESIARIQGHIYRRRKQKESTSIENKQAAASEQGSAPTTASPQPTLRSETSLSKITAEDEAAMQELITKFGVTAEKAYELINENAHQTRQQLRYWAFRPQAIANPAGWIIEAIQGNYAPPKEYLEREAAEKTRQSARREAAKAAERARVEAKSRERRQAAEERYNALSETERTELYTQAKALLLEGNSTWEKTGKTRAGAKLFEMAIRNHVIESLLADRSKTVTSAE